MQARALDLYLESIICAVHIPMDLFQVRVHPVPFGSQAVITVGGGGGGDYLVARHGGAGVGFKR